MSKIGRSILTFVLIYGAYTETGTFTALSLLLIFVAIELRGWLTKRAEDWIDFAPINAQLSAQQAGAVGGMGELSRALVRAYAALEEINRYNRIHNDVEAYLFKVAEWGMGQSTSCPNAADFGLPEPAPNHRLHWTGGAARAKNQS